MLSESWWSFTPTASSSCSASGADLRRSLKTLHIHSNRSSAAAKPLSELSRSITRSERVAPGVWALAVLLSLSLTVIQPHRVRTLNRELLRGSQPLLDVQPVLLPGQRQHPASHAGVTAGLALDRLARLLHPQSIDRFVWFHRRCPCVDQPALTCFVVCTYEPCTEGGLLDAEEGAFSVPAPGSLNAESVTYDAALPSAIANS